jgi:hypothetical protein
MPRKRFGVRWRGLTVRHIFMPRSRREDNNQEEMCPICKGRHRTPSFLLATIWLAQQVGLLPAAGLL